MATIHGKGTVVLFDQYNLGLFCDSAEIPSDRELADTTCFGATAHEFIAGLRNGTLSLSGKADFTASTGSDDILQTAMAGTGQVVTVGFGGSTIGNRARLMLVLSSAYTPSIPVADVITWAGDFQANGGIDAGVFLHALGAETGTGNDTSVDNLASSANGFVAHIHVTVDDVTTCQIDAQHSADDITFADLTTNFSATTVVGAQRVTGTGTVNRYTRSRRSVFTGTSATYAVALARR